MVGGGGLVLVALFSCGNMNPRKIMKDLPLRLWQKVAKSADLRLIILGLGLVPRYVRRGVALFCLLRHNVFRSVESYSGDCGKKWLKVPTFV